MSTNGGIPVYISERSSANIDGGISCMWSPAEDNHSVARDAHTPTHTVQVCKGCTQDKNMNERAADSTTLINQQGAVYSTNLITIPTVSCEKLKCNSYKKVNRIVKKKVAITGSATSKARAQLGADGKLSRETNVINQPKLDENDNVKLVPTVKIRTKKPVIKKQNVKKSKDTSTKSEKKANETVASKTAKTEKTENDFETRNTGRKSRERSDSWSSWTSLSSSSSSFSRSSWTRSSSYSDSRSRSYSRSCQAYSERRSSYSRSARYYSPVRGRRSGGRSRRRYDSRSPKRYRRRYFSGSRSRTRSRSSRSRSRIRSYSKEHRYYSDSPSDISSSRSSYDSYSRGYTRHSRYDGYRGSEYYRRPVCSRLYGNSHDRYSGHRSADRYLRCDEYSPEYNRRRSRCDEYSPEYNRRRSRCDEYSTEYSRRRSRCDEYSPEYSRRRSRSSSTWSSCSSFSDSGTEYCSSCESVSTHWKSSDLRTKNSSIDLWDSKSSTIPTAENPSVSQHSNDAMQRGQKHKADTDSSPQHLETSDYNRKTKSTSRSKSSGRKTVVKRTRRSVPYKDASSSGKITHEAHKFDSNILCNKSNNATSTAKQVTNEPKPNEIVVITDEDSDSPGAHGALETNSIADAEKVHMEFTETNRSCVISSNETSVVSTVDELPKVDSKRRVELKDQCGINSENGSAITFFGTRRIVELVHKPNVSLCSTKTENQSRTDLQTEIPNRRVVLASSTVSVPQSTKATLRNRVKYSTEQLQLLYEIGQCLESLLTELMNDC